MKNNKIEDILSNEALSKFLNSLKWEYVKDWTGSAHETAYLYEVKQKSIIMASFLEEKYIDFDGYYYKIGTKRIERYGDKVRKPNPVSKFLKSMVHP